MKEKIGGDADRIFRENSKVVVVVAYYQQCVDVADHMQIYYTMLKGARQKE